MNAAAHGLPTEADVDAILKRLDAGRALSALELEQHITDCTALWMRAYERFQELKVPADRDEALLWLHRRDEAVLLRPGVARMLGRTGDYFIDQADRDRAALAAGGTSGA